MMTSQKYCLFLIFVFLALSVLFFREGITAEASSTAQVMLGGQPEQTDISKADAEPLAMAGHDLVPRASFRIDAIVLSARIYESGKEAAVSPVDLALAWGDLAIHEGITQLEVSQVDRYYLWNFAAGSLLDSRTVTINSANMHMIPGTEEVRSRLLAIRKGDKVSLRGRLVDVRDPDGKTWHTSMSRTDMGDGACEIILVEEMSVELVS